MVKVKHGWPTENTNNEINLIFRIIKSNLPDLFDDIKIVINSRKNLAHHANLYSTYEVAKRGEIERAFDYLISLDTQECEKCCEITINTLTHILDNNEVDEIEAKNLVEYWNLIVHKFPKFEKNDLKIMKNILQLRQNFNLDINLETLQNKNNLPAILKLGLEHAIDNMNKNHDECIIDVWQKIHFLTMVLEMDIIEAITEVCKHMNDINFSCCMTYMMLRMGNDNINIENILELAAVLMAQQLKTTHQPDKLIEFYDPLTFPLVEKLLSLSIIAKHNKINYIEIYTFMQLSRIGRPFYDIDILDDKLEYFKKLGKCALSRHLECNGESNLSKLSNAESKKNRRESLSIFDIAMDVSNTQSSKIQKDPDVVLKFILYSMRILIHIVRVDNAPFKRILNVLDEENEPDIEE